jgi:hypothetical protein
VRRDAQFFQRDPSGSASGRSETGEGNPAAGREIQVGAEEDVSEVELPLLYLSKRLREALRLEGFLTSNNIDYLVEAGPYTGGLLFRRELTGAYFFVAEADLARARDLIAANGYRPFSEP